LRNKIDLDSNPQALFLNPWRDEGLKLLAAPEFVWREIKGAVIEGFAVSAHSEINAKIRSFVAHSKRHKQFQTAIETNTVPVVLDHASFRKSHVMADDKLVLSGASATRLLNAYRWENEKSDPDPVSTLNAYLEDCRTANAGKTLAIEQTFIEPDLDFAVECRNTFNYYHFMTESLSQLCVLDAVGFQGDVYFHFPNQEEKHRNFADAFVEALFPEYAAHVFFERAPKDYDLVLTSFDMLGAVGQMPHADVAGIAEIAPQGSAVGSVEFQPLLAMNSVSTAILSLRARALAAVAKYDFSYLPKRFFVGRGDAQSRSRPLGGEDLLLEQLERFGFQYVVFEELQPLEQIAQIAAFILTVLGHTPKITNAATLETLGRRVLRAGSPARAVELLEKHSVAVEKNVTLCLLRADCHKALDEPKSELVALEQAYEADPARWQTLVRIIWCANRCERPSVIRWALSHLAADFPDRHDAFVSNHEWVRFVA